MRFEVITLSDCTAHDRLKEKDWWRNERCWLDVGADGKERGFRCYEWGGQEVSFGMKG